MIRALARLIVIQRRNGDKVQNVFCYTLLTVKSRATLQRMKNQGEGVTPIPAAGGVIVCLCSVMLSAHIRASKFFLKKGSS